MQINVNFIEGAFCEVLSDIKSKFYIQFIDQDADIILHDAIIDNNMWVKCCFSYYINYKIKILDYLTRNLIEEINFNLKNKRVYIAFDSKSLGDNISWIPFVEEFKIKHGCHVICSTFYNELLEKSYPDINFVEPGSVVNNLYAMYNIGCYDDKFKSRRKWNSSTNQGIISDILGLELRELKTNLVFSGYRPLDKEYVCLSPSSSSGCKFWHYPDGWNDLVKYLSKKYKVVVLGDTENIITGDIIKPITSDIKELSKWIYYCKFLVGLCSGNSWLAWAYNKPVVMIGGFSSSKTEFFTSFRVMNKNVCYGCWNNAEFIFNKGDWNWCPKHKNTNRQFECSKEITLDMVIEKIDILL